MSRLALWLVVAAAIAAGCASDSNDVQASQPAEVVAPEPEPELEAEPAPTEAAAVESEPEPTVSLRADELFPTVVGATATSADAGTWRFDVTLSSPYDTPTRYADAWRVLDTDDNELGIRVLTHDHAGEQPFTRSQNIEVPAGVTTVFIEGRDQLNGWSGERFELTLTA